MVQQAKDRLEKTSELALQQLRQASETYKHHYDKKASSRKFKVGDKVLLLLPTNANKLLMQWKGPYDVVEKIDTNDYKIQLPSGLKTFHANLLKKYHVMETDKQVLQPVGMGVLENDDEPDLVNGIEFPCRQQKETYKDVTINPKLSATTKSAANLTE